MLMQNKLKSFNDKNISNMLSIYKSLMSNCRIEWLAYDYHSGIDSIYWRLYDNVTGDEIIHGHEELFAQGSTEVRAVSV